MMISLLFALGLGSVSVQDISKKLYNRPREDREPVIFAFSVIFALVECIAFVFLSGFDLSASPATMRYCLFMGVMYTLANVFSVLLFKNGPLSLGTMMHSFSMVIPSLTGVALLGETFSLTAGIGLALLIVSVLLLNVKSGDGSMKVTPKWIVLAVLLFLSNGVATAGQKYYIATFGGAERYQMSFYSQLLSALIFLVLFLFTKKEHNVKQILRAAPYAAVNSLGNIGYTVAGLMLAGLTSASLMYPVLSAGRMILSGIIGMVFFHERPKTRQAIAYGIGILAVIVLNL